MADPAARFAMIMAGGAGTRLWPMSRRARPKQLLPFIEGRSLLEIAARRLDGVVAPPRKLICTGEAYRGVIRAALPDFSDEQILGEPVGRDTVNAVGLTAAVLHARTPDAVFAVLTADHLIEPDAEFRRGLDVGFRLVEEDPNRFITFAIAPTFAATNYGWVERGDPVAGAADAFVASRFIEKPLLPEAETLLASGRCGWNSGMFVFHAGTFLETLARYQPASHTGLTEIAAAWDTPNRVATLERLYPTLPKISVDYAVMEPAAGDDAITICAVPIDVQWRDVGSWPSYGETLDADPDGNRANTPLQTIDSQRILAVSDDPDHLVAVIGCKDLIVVRTADVTLVCRTADAEKVKAMVEGVEERRR